MSRVAPRVTVLSALLALVAAQAAEAGTLKLNWVEKTSTDYGYPPMTFSVKSITIEGKRWTMRASVANRSSHVVSVTQGKPAEGDLRFGLVLPLSGNACSVTGTCFPKLLGSRQSRPTFPSSLKPGQVWTGTFSGVGSVPRGKAISVAFGFFVDTSSKKQFSWITRHSFKL